MTVDKVLRNLDHGYFMTHQEQAEAAIIIRRLQQAVLDEREACAKLVEQYHPDSFFMGQVQDAANLIRARSST